MSFFILDPFSVATIENIDLIPTDVYQNITESVEFKCLVKAHYEQINEVKSNVTIHFTIATCFSFYYANIQRFINILRFFFTAANADWNCGKLLLKIFIVMNVLCKWMVHNHFIQFNCVFFCICSLKADDAHHCLTDFDSILCWPKTLRGAVAYLPCLAEFKGVHYDISSKRNFKKQMKKIN